ncbi:MAG: hypothetical protein JW915_07585 [Chitinispirillaceae bacterium]|nr:hypothetical protein [Chitinispirillaceae bacterium]
MFVVFLIGDTLFAFDISAPDTISLMNQLPLLQLRDIFIYDNRLFGYEHRGNDVIVNISSPDSLVEIDSKTDTSFCQSAATEELIVGKLLFYSV